MTVSTLEQDVTPQTDELKKAGCQRIFQDKISGVKAEHLGLEEALDFLCKGDSLVVWQLDRFDRSVKHLPETEANSTGGGDDRLVFHFNTGAVSRTLQSNVSFLTAAGAVAMSGSTLALVKSAFWPAVGDARRPN